MIFASFLANNWSQELNLLLLLLFFLRISSRNLLSSPTGSPDSTCNRASWVRTGEIFEMQKANVAELKVFSHENRKVPISITSQINQ